MTDMRRFIEYMICSVIAAFLLAGCKGDHSETKVDMGPEAVIETFTRHIAAGEWEEAIKLCDTTSMQGYINDCISVWERLEKKDSSSLAIASSLLAGAEFKVEKTEKADGGRSVYYSIEAEGKSKKKKATLRKEEGEWRVGMITDAI